MDQFILAIDQGTTSSRAILFSSTGKAVKSCQQEFIQHYPQSGWVEHDPEEIWSTTLATCRAVIKESGLAASKISAIGITNQRETTLLWDRRSGKALHKAIVWQDRRTTQICENLKSDGKESFIQNKTGLLLDPYFSASKLAWLLDNVPNARVLAEQGHLAFGTVDSFLLWRLTEGQSHYTDATNASRTMLFNIHDMQWDHELLTLFNIPESLLLEVKNSADNFGVSAVSLFGEEIPITALIGDQQAALVGQGCFQPGMAKSTYGTGCFLMLNTGNKPLHSTNQLLSTVAYQVKGETTYALEGSVFIAGAVVQWLRDSLKLIDSAEETETIAEKRGIVEDVYVVPAFTGLGAPHWDPDARAAILGMSRGTGADEIVTASLQSVAFQTKDLLDAMAKDGAQLSTVLRVDGGMANNRWFVQFLSDLLGVEVDIPESVESTALGAAFMAGLGAGVYQSLTEIAALSQGAQRYHPQMDENKRQGLYTGWLAALARVKS
ncbi:MAG: glycerol kinase GlpK [Pseudomonadales bacterium]|nr:glycerol kinase GlpK [Pseudomonadales bacterium]